MERVFKWLTAEGGSSKAAIYTNWFASTFEPNSFDGVNRMLACYIKYCAKLSIVPKREYLMAYLKVDGKRDVKKFNIKTDTMSSYDYRETSQLEEAFRVITELTTSTYDMYVSVDLTDRDFKVDMYEFMMSLKSDLIQNAMMKAVPRLSDGSDIGEVSSDLRAELSSLDKVFDTRKLRNVDVTNPDAEEGELEFLCPTGLPCIDGDIGGVYTHIMTTLTAQPGGGKTRMGEAHWVYPMMTIAKKDVLFYENELTAMQVKNILIAHHITRLYGGRIKIPDSLMNKKKEMSPEQLQIYEAAKIDLFESGKYGKLIIKEECIVETYEDEATDIIKESGNLGLIVIDYMGLCRSVPESKYDRSMEQFEIITKAYEITRRILKAYDVAALCINQYNDKGIDAAYAGKPIRSGYVQGGHIVQRHTDYDLSMTFTEEQELAGVRMLSVSKRRGTAGFKNVLLSTDLAVSVFRQELNTK